MHILVVEDDLRIARLVSRVLTDAGHRVKAVDDGATGLEHASTGAFDLIVLDVLLHAQ